MDNAKQDQPWWKAATIYQIYPSSFQDSNRDGIGDVPGVIRRLPYLHSLGIDAIWICPIYASPQVDMGYDISDYKAIYPPYGTVEDVERLVEGCRAVGLKVIMDLVGNHTSDQHEWFKESQSSKDNPKRDWYIWRPAEYAEDGARLPPNNWRSAFGGGAWEWNEPTQEYYLHLFAKEQPDLNWENVAVRQAVYDEQMIFWLEKGIDGFRIDCANLMSKPSDYPDAPITDPTSQFQDPSSLVCNGSRIMEYMDEIGAVLRRYGAMSVGETPHTSGRDAVLEYVGASKKRLSMVFQFDVVEVGLGKPERLDIAPHSWKLSELKAAVRQTQSFLAGTDGWTTTYIENHDLARSVSRFCDDSPQYRERSAKLLATLFASLSGTLFIYQGQEIGMINLSSSVSVQEYKDVASINYYQAICEKFDEKSQEAERAKASLQHLARDHSRTPMQWTAAKNGGFTSDDVQPWMIVNSSTKEINVAEQENRENSVLSFWREMLKTRKQYADMLLFGEFELVDEDNGKLFSFVKRSGEREALIVLNFTGDQVSLPDVVKGGKWKLVMGNVDDYREDRLEGWEGRLYISQ